MQSIFLVSTSLISSCRVHVSWWSTAVFFCFDMYLFDVFQFAFIAWKKLLASFFHKSINLNCIDGRFFIIHALPMGTFSLSDEIVFAVLKLGACSACPCVTSFPFARLATFWQWTNSSFRVWENLYLVLRTLRLTVGSIIVSIYWMHSVWDVFVTNSNMCHMLRIQIWEWFSM